MLIAYATLGCLLVGKRVCMSMEVYIDCACRLLGDCRIKEGVYEHGTVQATYVG